MYGDNYMLLYVVKQVVRKSSLCAEKNMEINKHTATQKHFEWFLTSTVSIQSVTKYRQQLTSTFKFAILKLSKTA